LHTTAQALTAATAKTLLQLVTPSTRRVWINEIGISFKSSTTTDAPILVELLRQTTAGTMSAATPLLEDPADAASLCTGCQQTATVEPTASDILRHWDVAAQAGLVVYQFPLGMEIVMAVSTKLGLRATAPQTQAGVEAYILYTE
jgi:hypothetical protein